MSEPERVQPLSPYQVMEHAATIRAQWFSKFIKMVNDSLCTQAGTLEETGAADIHPTLADPLDPHGWHYWQVLSHDLVEWFEDKGWIVEPGEKRYEFIFRLPGILIDGEGKPVTYNVTTGDNTPDK